MYIIKNKSSVKNEKIQNFLKENERNIFDFFNIENNIIINIEILSKNQFHAEYKKRFKSDASNHVTGYIDDSMCKIIMLAFEDFKYTIHKDNTEEDYLKIILHELVHIIHSIYCNRNYPEEWLWEGIACYLSNQYDLKIMNYKNPFKSIMHNKGHYADYALMVKEIIIANDHNYILDLLANKKVYKLK